MATPESDLRTASASTRGLHDRRTVPPGVLPRRLQTWLMAGLAAVIVLIIVITGRSAPVPRSLAPSLPPAPATAERIRGYQRQLEDEQRRQAQLDQQQAALDARGKSSPTNSTPQTSSDTVADEQRRQELHSLFADNVAFTRRTISSSEVSPPSAAPKHDGVRAGNVDARAAGAATGDSDATTSPTTSEHTTTAAPTKTTKESPRTEYPAAGLRVRLLEGTVIETALINRLDGTFAGPVACLVTTPVYAPDRQHVLVPAGARVVGTSTPVQNWGESRLAVAFHRLLMPDGHTYSLDAFKGLDQIGATGLRDEVNRHYLQVFGASIAIGAIAGLAQYNTRTGIDDTFTDAYRQAAGASLATSSGRVLDRYLNVLPTVTIREGFRIKVYLTNDLELPVYADEGGGR